MKKLINFLGYCVGVVSIFLVKVYIHVVYRPKALFIDKTRQTNVFRTPCVIISNHTALWDPPFLMSVLRGKKSIIVAKDWFEKRSIQWIIKTAHGIPCDRYNLDTEWALQAKKALQAGRSVIIFPEGKIRTDGELNEFKSGFAFLARSTGFPVVCIGLDGTYRFGHRVHYAVGTPENLVRLRSVSSSEDLAIKASYFRDEVGMLKKYALEKTIPLMNNEDSCN